MTSYPFVKWTAAFLADQVFTEDRALFGMAFKFLVDEGVVRNHGRRHPRGSTRSKAFRTGPVNCSQAHRAGLTTRVKFAARELKAVEFSTGVANRDHFCVRGRIVAARY